MKIKILSDVIIASIAIVRKGKDNVFDYKKQLTLFRSRIRKNISLRINILIQQNKPYIALLSLYVHKTTHNNIGKLTPDIHCRTVN